MVNCTTLDSFGVQTAIKMLRILQQRAKMDLLLAIIAAEAAALYRRQGSDVLDTLQPPPRLVFPPELPSSASPTERSEFQLALEHVLDENAAMADVLENQRRRHLNLIMTIFMAPVSPEYRAFLLNNAQHDFEKAMGYCSKETSPAMSRLAREDAELTMAVIHASLEEHDKYIPNSFELPFIKAKL